MSSDAAGVQPVTLAGAGGVIHDIGYRQYGGQRFGRPQIVRALAIDGLRTSFGLGRGVKAKIFPVLLFLLMCLPAVVSIAAMALNPANGQLISYDTYQSTLRPLVLLVFVALQAPNLVSGDLRYHTLPLYFARPISRSDYPVAKLIGFTMACLRADRDPVADPVGRNDLAGARRQRRMAPDHRVRSRPALRRRLGGAAGQHRAGTGVGHRQAGIRHQRRRDPVVRDLGPGHRPQPRRAADLPAGGRARSRPRWPACPA